MNAKDSRSHAQLDASRRNGARSSGPRTVAGKLRSSANALRHGICAKTLSPPGEHPEESEAMLKSWTLTLSPSTPGEALIAAELRSVQLRLKRLDIAEKREMSALVEERVAESVERRFLILVDRCRLAMSALRETIVRRPNHLSSLPFFFDGAHAALVMLQELERQSPPGTALALEPFRKGLEAVPDFTGDPQVIDSALQGLLPAVTAVLRKLNLLRRRAKSAESDAEACVAASIASDASQTRRRLTTYRSQLLTEMNRLLTIFSQLKGLRGLELPRP